MDINLKLTNFHQRASKLLGCQARVSATMKEVEGKRIMNFYCTVQDSWMEDNAPSGYGKTVNAALNNLSEEIEKLETEVVA